MKKSVLILCLVISILLLLASAFYSIKSISDIVNNATLPDYNGNNAGKLRAIECPAQFRNNEICTKEYIPVCGWFNSSRVQCIDYPCAIQAGNVCEACSNNDVEYYTDGLCPTGDGKLI